MILVLGDLPLDLFPNVDRDRLKPAFLSLYREHPDAGVHSALGWLLKRWGLSHEVAAIDGELATNDPVAGRNWFVDSQGHTFSIVHGPVEFARGVKGSNTGLNFEPLHRSRIPRSFAVATHEVTIEQFERFKVIKDHELTSGETRQCPMANLRYDSALRYCRWLSEQAGISESEMCYKAPDGRNKELTPYPDYLSRTGYRLPTSAEWEYACRAGTTTLRHFSESAEFSDFYECTLSNSDCRRFPVGRLKPNDLGFFDMLGNVQEFTPDKVTKRPLTPDMLVADVGGGLDSTSNLRILRGSHFRSGTASAVSSVKQETLPYSMIWIGFRPARTVRP